MTGDVVAPPFMIRMSRSLVRMVRMIRMIRTIRMIRVILYTFECMGDAYGAKALIMTPARS